MPDKYLISSESVTEGHPDKVCDIISDSILDEMLRQDSDSRVAVECLTTTGTVHVAGEVTTKAYVDIQKVVRNTLKEIGYTSPDYGIDCESAGVWVSIHEQSPDINIGVTEGLGDEKGQGAGDQGMMFGYASDETDVLMPLTIVLAHKLTARLAEVRKQGLIKGIGPDGKSQVTIEYENGKPSKLLNVVIAQQHIDGVPEDELRTQIFEKVIKPVCANYLNDETKIHINATGTFVIGGPQGDTGLTGRKIIVDTYGGVGRHGGGAFSGKDPSKVDRSGSYMARYVAKNIVAAGLAHKCEVQLSYVIGVAAPTNVNIDCFGTETVEIEKIKSAVLDTFDFRPKAIIEDLRLKRPIYSKTARNGHFGKKDPDFTWENTDKAEKLKEIVNND